tara:strand:+ start:7629 stop:7916 length:288 start_codon:yes stop_codon:yes gene_type:complete
MRFAHTLIVLLAAAVQATPTPSITIEDLNAAAIAVAHGGPVPEGVTMISARNPLMKRQTYCGGYCDGTCCCTFCSSGRFGQSSLFQDGLLAENEC